MSAPTFDFRDAAFTAVLELAKADPNVVVLTNDMGAMGLDKIREALPRQVINVGISEQNMMSTAGGLALGGKTVFVYGIAAHITARCFEQIKIDICVGDLPVTLLGVGAGLSYGPDGPTHHGVEDVAILRSLANMHIYNPADAATTRNAVALAYRSRRPSYVRLDKEILPELYPEPIDYERGLAVVAEGEDAAVVSTGVLTWTALDAAKRLGESGVGVRVVDLFRLKPVNEDALAEALARVRAVVTVEENVPDGGLGSIVAELIAKRGLGIPFRKLSLGPDFLLGSSPREWADAQFGLTPEGVAKAVRDLLGQGSSR